MSSPGLFNLYSDATLKDEGILPGYIIRGHDLNNIRHTDDTEMKKANRNKTVKNSRRGSQKTGRKD